jgi:hypothetical protein
MEHGLRSGRGVYTWQDQTKYCGEYCVTQEVGKGPSHAQMVPHLRVPISGLDQSLLEVVQIRTPQPCHFTHREAAQKEEFLGGQ